MEYKDQQQHQEWSGYKLWHRIKESDKAHYRRVEPAVVMEGRQDAQRDAEEGDNQRGRQAQLNGNGQPGANDVQHRTTAFAERVAPVAVQQPVHIALQLHAKGLVQPVLGP